MIRFLECKLFDVLYLIQTLRKAHSSFMVYSITKTGHLNSEIKNCLIFISEGDLGKISRNSLNLPLDCWQVFISFMSLVCQLLYVVIVRKKTDFYGGNTNYYPSLLHIALSVRFMFDTSRLITYASQAFQNNFSFWHLQIIFFFFIRR